jgi:hypothetical protein
LPVVVTYAAADPEPIRQFSIHYSLSALPLLFFGAVLGIRRLATARSRAATPDHLRMRLRLWTLALLVACALDGAGYRFSRPRPVAREIEPALASIGDRPVRIQGSLYPRAGYAKSRLYLDRAPGSDEAVLLAPDTDPYPFSRDDLDALVRRLLADPSYRHTRTPGGLLLFTPAH